MLRATGVQVAPTPPPRWRRGSDGYLATVTLAEATVGGRSLLLATTEDGLPLAHPRLVHDGDVRGGRYVSGVVTLLVSRGGCGRG